MDNFKDLMIDLETLGTNVDAPIISIGARFFDLETKTKGPHFYQVFDVADQIDSKTRFANASTIKWWMSQQDAAKNVFKDNAAPTQLVLKAFAEWVLEIGKASKKSKASKSVNAWGNGSSFDVTLMETLFNDYNVPCPWMYHNIMDLRTFRRFVGMGAKIEKTGVNHNALDDVNSQIDYMFSVYSPAPQKRASLSDLLKKS